MVLGYIDAPLCHAVCKHLFGGIVNIQKGGGNDKVEL